jgi:hypothetical protein
MISFTASRWSAGKSFNASSRSGGSATDGFVVAFLRVPSFAGSGKKQLSINRLTFS